LGWNALIVGLGQIGMGYDLALAPGRFVYSHARALSLHPEFNLVGAVDPGARERAAFMQTYELSAYESLEQALAAQAVDLVVIATPTPTHHALLRELLDLAHPKAILCEKPLSYSLDESRKMLELCAEKNAALYVNYMRRSEPGAIEVKRRIDSGEIAGPVKGVAWYSKGFLHNGSHFFNLLQYWLGDARGFDLVDSGRALTEGDAEPDVRVIFENGEIVFLAAKDENFSHNAIELVAKNGRLRYENGGRRIEWSAAGADENLKSYTFLAASPEEIPSRLNHYQWHVTEQLADALKGGKAHLCDGAHALQTLEAMHLILESRG
jgi:predicted dehydrogenase